jgi:hypothetical protein
VVRAVSVSLCVPVSPPDWPICRHLLCLLVSPSPPTQWWRSTLVFGRYLVRIAVGYPARSRVYATSCRLSMQIPGYELQICLNYLLFESLSVYIFWSFLHVVTPYMA